MRSGQAVIVDNPWQHPRVLQAKQEISRSEAYVQVPIFGQEEKIIGLLSADYHYSRRQVSPRDAAQLLAYASMVGLTIENIRLYTELEGLVERRTAELHAALVRAQSADQLKSQFLAAISLEKAYKDRGHDALKGMINSVVFTDEAKSDDFIDAFQIRRRKADRHAEFPEIAIGTGDFDRLGCHAGR